MEARNLVYIVLSWTELMTQQFFVPFNISMHLFYFSCYNHKKITSFLNQYLLLYLLTHIHNFGICCVDMSGIKDSKSHDNILQIMKYVCKNVLRLGQNRKLTVRKLIFEKIIFYVRKCAFIFLNWTFFSIKSKLSFR